MDDIQMRISTTAADGSVVESAPFTSTDLKNAASAQGVDPLIADVGEFVIIRGKCSTSEIQAKFGIGYNKAARIVEGLEVLGVVTSPDSVGYRHVAATELPKSLEIAVIAQKAVKSAMKETDADREVKDGVYRVAAAELRQFIERFERLEAEKKDIADQQKEVMAEAKARGYDTKVMRLVIARRKRDKDDIAEEEAVLSMYLEALGM